jgi:uncharacterized protein YecT (DUF1311 family)
MLRVTATLVVTVLTIVSPFGSREGEAQSSAGRPAPRLCGDLATQSEMNACFAREAARVGALLDTLLKEIRPSLEEGQRKGLDEAQRQWLRYRDAHCNWVASSSDGGTIQPTVRATCLAAVTWERIGELKLTLCEGGAGLGGTCAASRRYDRPRER